MRPKPLMPTRTVTVTSTVTSNLSRVTETAGSAASLGRTLSVAGIPGPRSAPGPTGGGRSLRQHVVGDDGFGVRDAEILGPLVGHCQQPADPARHRVLGHGRGGALAQLLQGGLSELQAEAAGDQQVLWGGSGQGTAG